MIESKKKFLDLLPDEIIKEIINFLPPKDALKLGLTDKKRFTIVSKYSSFWKNALAEQQWLNENNFSAKAQPSNTFFMEEYSRRIKSLKNIFVIATDNDFSVLKFFTSPQEKLLSSLGNNSFWQSVFDAQPLSSNYLYSRLHYTGANPVKKHFLLSLIVRKFFNIEDTLSTLNRFDNDLNDGNFKQLAVIHFNKSKKTLEKFITDRDVSALICSIQRIQLRNTVFFDNIKILKEFHEITLLQMALEHYQKLINRENENTHFDLK